MTRSFYSSAIAFTAIYTFLILFKSILYLVLGVKASGLTSIGGWFVFEFLVWLVWSVILLKYYHYYQYSFVFWALILSIAASVFHFFSFLQLLQTKEILNFYILAIFVSLVSNILYSISLTSSSTNKKRWLRIAGIVLFVEGFIMACSIIWTMNSTSFMQSGMLNRIERWVALIGVLVPFAFILHFSEEKKTNTITSVSNQESWVSTINLAIFIVAMGGLYFCSMLVLDSLSITKNARKADDNLKKLGGL